MVKATQLMIRTVFTLRFTVGLNGTPMQWGGVGLALCGEDSRGSARAGDGGLRDEKRGKCR